MFRFGITLAAGGDGIFATVQDPLIGLYGAGSAFVWCSSCHDVHDNANQPFLVMANTGSALCLGCHDK
jgi:predicted CXXCH cytochrome family protein